MTADPSADWRPAIRALLYCVQFDHDPLAGVDRAVRTVIAGNALDRARAEYGLAIEEALASEESLAELIPQAHSEASVRSFLQAVQLRILS